MSSETKQKMIEKLKVRQSALAAEFGKTLLTAYKNHRCTYPEINEERRIVMMAEQFHVDLNDKLSMKRMREFIKNEDQLIGLIS